MQRKDDKAARTYFRTDRLFHQTGGWYFATRDGDRGPYEVRHAAETALRQYVAELQDLKSFQNSRDNPARAPHVMTVVPRVAHRRTRSTASEPRTNVLDYLL